MINQFSLYDLLYTSFSSLKAEYIYEKQYKFDEKYLYFFAKGKLSFMIFFRNIMKRIHKIPLIMFIKKLIRSNPFLCKLKTIKKR